MVISPPQREAVIEHCRAAFPNEACGLLASENGHVVQVYPLQSKDPSPVFFHIDPHEQLKAMLDMDDRGWDLGAIFHSHTRTPAYPSQTDIGLAHYPDALYVIVSLADEAHPEMRAFRIQEGVVSEEAIEVSA
ncbi:MAG: M67 family metallopeptidase [Chloroflexota bacterium]